MKRIILFTTIGLLAVLVVSATAIAAWPDGAQGDQYNGVNNAMLAAVAGVGLSPESFTSIYNTAAANGDLSGFTTEQLTAECRALNSLSAYSTVLTDYNAVYSRLGCSSIAEASAPIYRGALPGTGIAIGLLAGSGLIGMVAASRLLRRSRKM